MSKYMTFIMSGLEMGSDTHGCHLFSSSMLHFEEVISIALTIVLNNYTCRNKFMSVHCNHFLLTFAGHCSGLF
jgi:hypothetical protein